MTFNVEALRAEFQILHREANGKPLVYLDNAATTQKPDLVIDAIEDYYRAVNSNVHRAAHYLSGKATQAFEQARQEVADYLGAKREEIIWTRGTTEAINLVAQCWGREQLGEGDEVLITGMEHHSNIVPWQMACERTGAVLKVIPVLENGALDMEAFDRLLNKRTKLVALCHVSNALGTVNPVADMVHRAREAGAVTLVDGAQAMPHFPVDVQKIGCDFYAFSGHKMFGPTGIGALYGREALLETMPPYQGGGEMIETVTFEKSTWNELPYKFEAGTPNIAGVVGLAAALEWLKRQDRRAMAAHERDLLAYATERAHATEGLKIIGEAPMKTSVLSFLLKDVHPNDVGMLLDQQGIAVRTGHHCTMPLMDAFGIPGTVRAAFAVYNTRAEVDQLFEGIEKVKTFV